MSIYVFLFIIIIVDILLAHFYPKLRGLVGEFYIKRELKSLPKDYLVFNNITIKDEWETHQIDHIVVSKYGINVILKFNEEIIDHLAPVIVTITNDNIKDKKLRLNHNKEIKEKIKNKNVLDVEYINK